MLGGLRAPDLVRIIALPQPTVWRIIERLRLAGALRVVTTYRDGVPGRRAAWIQPAGSADLSDARRAALMETAERIRAYRRPWEKEQARALMLEQGLLEPRIDA